MPPKYNILFVPSIEIRKKISPIRTKICKLVHSTQALQYPVHMSLVSSGFHVKDYSAFEKELKILCKQLRPMRLKNESFTSILPERFWTGISIRRTEEIARLQKRLQALRNKYASKKEEHPYHPLHITFAFPARVTDLKRIRLPITSMKFDRITIVKKDDESEPYKILKHIRFN